ncbi:hypothetical protein [Bacillus kwashiorkori]|uniref:hypothetical protein n=1 Tax=Bacillus kwashiorkori TaxID=1522318 RepID=UPI0007830F73|nr:hypothetical protein [Bacillus kwashiorkori]
MTKNQKPKFKIGDNVVITKVGNKGNVKKIVYIEGDWYYKLAEHDHLFAESSLQLKHHHEAKAHLTENIHVEYKYHFGDIVRVKGYGQQLFTVIGFRVEIWRYRESAWDDIIYELSRISDGQWLEASEEELTYITSGENALKLINSKKQTSAKPLLLSPPKSSAKTKETADIDTLLDMYNDYYFLYQNFEEANYKKKMNEILKKLEALSKNPFNNEKRS